MLPVPRLSAVIGVKLAEHPGEILVVQVQPVVLRQFALQHFRIIHHIIRDFSVGEYQRNSIVPGLNHLPAFVLNGRVNRNFGCLFQLDLVHVHFRIQNLVLDGRKL